MKKDPTNNATVVTTYSGPNVNLTKNKTVKELPPANVTFGKINNKGNMTIKFSREIVTREVPVLRYTVPHGVLSNEVLLKV